MTHNDQMRLALEAKVALTTVRAYLKGASIRPAIEEAIRLGAERLRLTAERPQKKRTRAA
jgi:hypothetical protein